LDPGRRSPGGEGRVILWRRAGCSAAGRLAPEAVAAALLRAAGLPQSAELPPPPSGCSWPPPPATLTSYGRPNASKAKPEAGGEYLENLRSLGYL
ncbi:MAG TPA: hypothetical protein VMM92_02505, partial [Thermoanaerobaculia bacterium]|nr:hypothetical protein [Thermoanaerobaculia bacterium]